MNITGLNNGLLFAILKKLSPRDWIVVSRVSKFFYKTISGEDFNICWAERLSPMLISKNELKETPLVFPNLKIYVYKWKQTANIGLKSGINMIMWCRHIEKGSILNENDLESVYEKFQVPIRAGMIAAAKLYLFDVAKADIMEIWLKYIRSFREEWTASTARSAAYISTTHLIKEKTAVYALKMPLHITDFNKHRTSIAIEMIPTWIKRGNLMTALEVLDDWYLDATEPLDESNNGEYGGAPSDEFVREKLKEWITQIGEKGEKRPDLIEALKQFKGKLTMLFDRSSEDEEGLSGLETTSLFPVLEELSLRDWVVVSRVSIFFYKTIWGKGFNVCWKRRMARVFQQKELKEMRLNFRCISKIFTIWNQILVNGLHSSLNMIKSPSQLVRDKVISREGDYLNAKRIFHANRDEAFLITAKYYELDLATIEDMECWVIGEVVNNGIYDTIPYGSIATISLIKEKTAAYALKMPSKLPFFDSRRTWFAMGMIPLWIQKRFLKETLEVLDVWYLNEIAPNDNSDGYTKNAKRDLLKEWTRQIKEKGKEHPEVMQALEKFHKKFTQFFESPSASEEDSFEDVHSTDEE